MKNPVVPILAIVAVTLIIFGAANYFTYGSIIAPDKPAQPKIELLENREIVSIERESGVSGLFVLGIGSVGSELYYIAYEKKGENTYSLFKVAAEGVDVTESDTEKPCYRVYGSGGFTQRRVLIVPKGTIRKEFKL